MLIYIVYFYFYILHFTLYTLHFLLSVSQFVVLKFLPTNEDPDIYIDVGLRKWICTDLDDEMCGQTYWPLNPKSVTQLVKTEQSFKTDWPKHDVEIKRFYSKILFYSSTTIFICRLSHIIMRSDYVDIFLKL